MNPLEDLLERSEMDRRRFLLSLGSLLGMTLLPEVVHAAATEWLLGKKEIAEGALPTYFVEINLRDQWDFGHVMVSPGLATYPDLIRGTTGRKAALFYTTSELKPFPNGVYLTGDSIALAPHLENIALLETCELPMGTIHGHEAANAIRSPGRGYHAGPGRMPLWLRDPKAKIGGNEDHYGTVPTPASLHNYVQKQITPGLANGLAFKGISRPEHTVYHFGAGLAGAELDRYQSVGALQKAMSYHTNVLPTAEEANLVIKFLKRIDQAYLARVAFAEKEKLDHLGRLDEVRKNYHQASVAGFNLALTAEEKDYWSAGVPEQQGAILKANIWEQCAYAAKLITGGVTRTVALEFDYLDVHDTRTEPQMRIMGRQTSLPLARLIETFKKAGIYDRTLIVMNTLDGGRSPAANSFGSEGKNGLILAGGKIKGGYYGDVRVGGKHEDGHRYVYHRPDDNGVPVAQGVAHGGGRVAGADVWRTVAKALEIPDALAGSFTDSAKGRVLPYLLKDG